MTIVAIATKSGELHGLINVLTNSVEHNDFKNFAPHLKEKMIKEKKEDSRMVKAEYMNSRGNHERLTTYYCKYAGDPIQKWHLIPGYVYDLPLGFVKQINDTNKHLKKRSGLVSIDGEKVTKDGSPLDSDQDGTWLHKLVPVGF